VNLEYVRKSDLSFLLFLEFIMTIVSVKEAAERTGANIRGIYKRIEDGILTKHTFTKHNGTKITGVNLDELLGNDSAKEIISAYEAANRLGITYVTLYKKLKAGTIPSYNIIGKNGKQVLGVNWTNFFSSVPITEVNTDTKKKAKKLDDTVLLEFNLDDALDGTVEIVHLSGEEVIEVSQLDSDVKNKVVYVRKNGFVDVCNEDGFFGNQQVLFVKGKKLWANVFRDEWNEYIVYEDRFSTEEAALKDGKKMEKGQGWKLITPILLSEPDYI